MENKGERIVITGMDGSGKTTLIDDLKKHFSGFSFKLPYHDFVREGLKISGNGKIMKDIHTDVLLFLADARITNYKIAKWKNNHRLLFSQRGRMDHFIFYKAQGLDYKETINLLKPGELEKPTTTIYLTTEPEIAYNRIKNDPNGDKYETLVFMKKQHQETLSFIDALGKDDIIKNIFTEKFIVIDTTKLQTKETLDLALKFIKSHRNF